MSIKVLLDSDAQLYVKKKRDSVFELEQLVYISEDINYVAKDTIDMSDADDGDIAYALVQHGGDMDSNRDIAVALFKEKCEQGEYSPN